MAAFGKADRIFADGMTGVGDSNEKQPRVVAKFPIGNGA